MMNDDTWSVVVSFLRDRDLSSFECVSSETRRLIRKEFERRCVRLELAGKIPHGARDPTTMHPTFLSAVFTPIKTRKRVLDDVRWEPAKRKRVAEDLTRRRATWDVRDLILFLERYPDVEILDSPVLLEAATSGALAAAGSLSIEKDFRFLIEGVPDETPTALVLGSSEEKSDRVIHGAWSSTTKKMYWSKFASSDTKKVIKSL